MQTSLNKLWKQWRIRNRQRRWHRLVQKHKLITEKGLTISATVLHSYEKNLYENMRLVYLRIRLEFLDHTKVVVLSKCLASTRPSLTEGQKIQFKFLPGDLSQIVLLFH